MKQAISYSGLKKYEQCPHQFYRTKVKKDIIEDFSGEAAVWGNKVHKALEDFLRESKPLTDEFKAYRYYAESLAGISGEKHVEIKLAMDRHGKPVEFFDKSAAYRGIIDYLVIREGGKEAFLIDHKTGKVRPTKQLHFNALLVFAAFPKVRILKTAFFWLPADSYTKHHFHRNDIDSIWGEFDTSLSLMQDSFETDSWPKRPSALCPWCPVHDCQHYNTSKRR